MVFFTAVLLTSATYVFLFLTHLVFPENYIWVIFSRPGSVPIAATTTVLFYMAIGLLAGKGLRLRVERAAFDLDFLPSNVGETIDQTVALGISTKIDLLQPAERRLILVNRLRESLQRLANTGSTSEMAQIMNDLSTVDRNQAESGYTIVKFLIALIPIFGFIGTVLGMSQAISQFSGLIEGAKELADIQGELGGVTTGLGTAFETTLIALVQSAIVMFLHASVQKREDDFLTEADSYLIKNVLGRLKVQTEAVSLSEVFAKEMQAINLSMVDRAAELEDAIRGLAAGRSRP